MIARILAMLGITIDVVDLVDVVVERRSQTARAASESLGWSLLAAPAYTQATWAQARPEGEQ